VEKKGIATAWPRAPGKNLCVLYGLRGRRKKRENFTAPTSGEKKSGKEGPGNHDRCSLRAYGQD